MYIFVFFNVQGESHGNSLYERYKSLVKLCDESLAVCLLLASTTRYARLGKIHRNTLVTLVQAVFD